MDNDRQGSLHPEREFQSMGLPLSFGNSNSRQARAATAAASRRTPEGAVSRNVMVHMPPPPPPPLHILKQTLVPQMHDGISRIHQQPPSTSHDTRMQRQVFIPPPPPATSHIQPIFYQHHQVQKTLQSPHSHLRAAPYGSPADNSGRKHFVSGGHQLGSVGPRLNPEKLFKDSMFDNPWRRGCV